MRALYVGWSAYTIWRTLDVRQRFERLVISNDSACRFDLFPGYTRNRMMLQVSLNRIRRLPSSTVCHLGARSGLRRLHPVCPDLCQLATGQGIQREHVQMRGTSCQHRPQV